MLQLLNLRVYLSRASKSALLALAPGVCVVICDASCCCCSLAASSVIARRPYELLRTPMIFSRVVSEASLSAHRLLTSRSEYCQASQYSQHPSTRQISKSPISMCDAIVAEVEDALTLSALLNTDVPRARLKKLPDSSTAEPQSLSWPCSSGCHTCVAPTYRDVLGPWVCLKQIPILY